MGAAAFSGLVGAIYWFVSYEPAGTFMLLTMMIGLGFAAGYLALLRRRASLVSDRPRIEPASPQGEPVGVFASRSPWPAVLGFGCAVGLTGLIYGWWLGALGAACVTAALVGLMREDRSAPSR
jgi:hypothetical protein